MTEKPEMAGMEYILKCGDKTLEVSTKELSEDMDFGHEIVGKNELIRRSDVIEILEEKRKEIKKPSNVEKYAKKYADAKIRDLIQKLKSEDGGEE